MNRAVLKDLRDAVTKHHDQFDMRAWCDTGTYIVDTKRPDIIWDRIAGASRPPCGTTMCFAGWIIFLNPEQAAAIGEEYRAEGYEWDIPDVAAAIAGLGYAERERLFYTSQNDAALAVLDEMIARA